MIPIEILPQPDDTTCGPTSLHAVYVYYGDDISLETVIAEVPYLERGGTLAVNLGIHGLRRGYDVTIYSHDLKVLDPTWFNLSPPDVIKRLECQIEHKESKKVRGASMAYIEYITLGGTLKEQSFSSGLLQSFFDRSIPVLSGLSATYLYQSRRELTDSQGRMHYDDVCGYPQGHFVVLCGYDQERRHVVVADPCRENPVSRDHYYSVDVDRLINAILLGIVTYDANLLIIQPRGKGADEKHSSGR
jgi:hypothetical protein